MSRSFYDVLGIQPDASPEDIRRAYKKKALQTHPDRLPGATPDEKRAAEEQFRKVNNAYEVLMNERNRKLYDLHGVWPPPEEPAEEPRRERGRHPGYRRPQYAFPYSGPFDDPFFNFPRGDPFSRHQPSYAFRDPFEQFDAMFADMHRSMHEPVAILRHDPHDPFGVGSSMFGPSNPLFRPYAPFFPTMPNFPHFRDDQWRSSSRPNEPNEPQTFSFQRSSRQHTVPATDGRRTKWVSESTVIKTVNGATESVLKRVDEDGNEHVTYTYSDGRKRYTMNGIEQPHSTAHIQDAPRQPLSGADPQYSSSPPIIPPDQGEGSSKKHRWWRH